MDERAVLQGRIRDLAKRADSRYYMTRTGFLSPEELRRS